MTGGVQIEAKSGRILVEPYTVKAQNYHFAKIHSLTET